MAHRLERGKIPKPDQIDESSIFADFVGGTDAILSQIEDRRKAERSPEEIKEMSMATRNPMIEARLARKNAQKIEKEKPSE